MECVINVTGTLRRSDTMSGGKTRINMRSAAPGMYMVLDLLARSKCGMTLSELVSKSPSKAAEVLQELYPGLPKVLIDSLIASVDENERKTRGRGNIA